MVTESNPQRSTTATRRILVVEDNARDLRLLKEAFKETASDASLQTATNGEDAIEVLRQLKSEEPTVLPDLVLSDLNLPGRDGHLVAEAIRNELDLRDLPVVIISRSDNNDDVRRCYEAKANAFLTKPTDFEELTRLIEGVEAFWCKSKTQSAAERTNPASIS